MMMTILINRNCHVIRLANHIVLRQLTSESTKVVPSANRAKLADPTETLVIEDQDVFGTLSTSGKRSLQVQSTIKTLPDDADGYDKVEFDIEPRKNTYYYKYEIAKYAFEGGPGLRKALELFQQMKSRDRLEPALENFSPLIMGCAKAGYTKRAFDLYEESLRYIKRPTKANVTCLINACAESPFPEYGLERLKWFLTHVKVAYNIQLNEIQYNCAIKAYGKLGQLEEASKLVQEMLDNDVIPTLSTFNMLLIGCASNKEAGCAIALRVFKRLKMYQFEPSPITYQLLLRCIRDCGMGSSKLIQKTLRELPAMTSLNQRIKYKKKNKAQKLDPKKRFISGSEWLPLLDDLGKSIKTAIKEPKEVSDKSLTVSSKSHKQNKFAESFKGQTSSELNKFDAIAEDISSDELVPVSDHDNQALPNLLSDDHLALMMRIKAIQFDKLSRPHHRLMLFGGLHGFLDTMMKDGCKPGNKVFTLILKCLEPTRENYLEYHKLANDMNINRDLLYYDTLIEEICVNGLFKDRLELALHFVEQMHIDNLRPNISTYQALALGCHYWVPAKKLLDDIENAGFVVSSALITNLLKKATKKMNFPYLCNLLDYCVKKNFKPWRRHVEELENLRLRGGDIMRQIERGQMNDESLIKKMKHFEKFRSKLDHWLQNVSLNVEHHPWEQFKVDTSSKRDGFRAYEKHFKVMERVKQEALTHGRSFGNLSHKAEKISRLHDSNPPLAKSSIST